jgi:hypothetical protein
VSNILAEDLRGKINLIEEKLKSVDASIRSADEDVENDLDSIIRGKSGIVVDDQVRKRIEEFKKQNKQILLQSKLDSLNRAKSELTQLKDDISFVLNRMNRRRVEDVRL